MDLRKEICEAGRRAVLKGRNIWGGANDNDMREEFLSALIAIELHEALLKPIRTELEYHAIYRVLAQTSSGERIKNIRADVVIGEMDGIEFVPTAIIEIKKFAEGGSIDSVVADLKKSDLLKLVPPVDAFAGVLVCETTSGSLQARKAVLESWFKESVVFSTSEKSKNEKWKWCFACIQRRAQADVL
jgi:hypothetical protein